MRGAAAPALAVVCAGGVLAACCMPAAAHGWSRPAQAAAPSTADIAPVALAISPGGAAALAYTVQAGGPPVTYLGAAPVATGAELLDLAWSAGVPQAVTGDAQPGHRCCASVSVRRLVPGRSSVQAIVHGLAGAAQGFLLALDDRREVAVAASDAGVWAAAAPAAGPFGATVRLTAGRTHVENVAAAALPGGRSLVAFTESPSPTRPSRSIFVSGAASGRVPSGRRLAVVRAPGHAIQSLSAAGGPGGALLGWVESVAGGGQQALVWDPDGAGPPQTLFADGGAGGAALAGGVTLAEGPDGDAVAAFQVCAGATCTVRVAVRPPGAARFGATVAAGQSDGAEAPQAAVGRGGEAFLGWISGGGVLVRRRAARGEPFAAAQALSRGASGGLDLVAAPGGGALAAWAEGTASDRVLSSRYR